MAHLSALLFLVITLAPAVALPCVNAIMLEGDEAVARVQRAEDKLASGKYQATIDILEGVDFTEPTMVLRAESLIEIARLRHARQTEASAIATARAVKIFEAILKDDPSSPLAKTRLAEALALSPKETDQLHAHGILESLNKADLIPDPYGYAILSYLRRLAGEDRAAAKALARCQTMTEHKKVGCKLSPMFKVPKRYHATTGS